MKDIKSAVYSLDGRTTTKESAWKMTGTRLRSIDQKKKGKRLQRLQQGVRSTFFDGKKHICHRDWACNTTDQRDEQTFRREEGRLSLANFIRDEQRWLEHLGDPRLCTSDGKSTQATASDRCMLPLKDPSEEPAPRSPPESLSASTETASPISPPGDPYYETPVFTPEYVDTPTPEQEPNHKRPDHYEEICTVSSDSSYSSHTSSSSSFPVTIRYQEDILHKISLVRIEHEFDELYDVQYQEVVRLDSMMVRYKRRVVGRYMPQ